MKDKKGVLGFETAQSVIMILLILAVIVIALFLALSTMLPIIQTTDTLSGSKTNESLGTVVNTGNETFAVVGVYQGLDCSAITVKNWTGSATINSANYSQMSASDGSNCMLNTRTTSGAGTNNTIWVVDYSYTYYGEGAVGTNNVNNNITSGVVKFMSYIPTIFTIMAIVVIILAIALILFAVNRFGGRSEGGL